jgi:hypothetical protein
VECTGGGGAGGVASGTASGAGGGAGGQYAKKAVSVSAGTSYTVTVGGVAVAVTTGGVVTNGNDSWFSTAGTVIAKGGAGGADATGATGAGGTGSTTGGIGDTVFAGGSGASGVSSTQSGGGGGGAGSSGTGNSASGATAGAAKTENGGAGGAGVSSANTQNNGNNYGGGGSGGLSSNATNRKGGDGAQGLVVLTWDINPSSIYFPFTNQPTRRLEASNRSLSAGQSSFSYVQAPSAAVGNPYISGQNVDPVTLESFQYPAIQEPPYIPSSGPTEPALISAQVADLRLARRRFRYEGSAAPLSVSAPPAETITLDKWLFRVRDPIRRAARLAAYGVNTALAREEIPTMEWSIQNPVPRRHRQGLKDNSFGVFTTGSPPSTPAIYIQGQSVDPQWSQSFQLDTLANPLRALSGVPETITLDKWFQAGVLPPRPIARREGFYRFVSLVSQAPETITLEKWFQVGALPQRRAMRTRDGFAYVFVSQTSETVTLDKWRAAENVFRRRRVSIDPRAAFVKVAPFGDLITLDKWLRYQPSQFPKRTTMEGQFRFYVIPILTIPPSSLAALWRNEATISLLAADLQALGIQAEDVESISIMAVSLAETDLITENSALVSVITKDEQSITILYEDVRTI